jgi:hypothetical protein
MLYAFDQRAYTATQIDYFAIYIIPDDVWYIFPASKLLGQTAASLRTAKDKSTAATKKPGTSSATEPAASPNSPASSSPEPRSEGDPGKITSNRTDLPAMGIFLTQETAPCIVACHRVACFY